MEVSHTDMLGRYRQDRKSMKQGREILCPEISVSGLPGTRLAKARGGRGSPVPLALCELSFSHRAGRIKHGRHLSQWPPAVTFQNARDVDWSEGLVRIAAG